MFELYYRVGDLNLFSPKSELNLANVRQFHSSPGGFSPPIYPFNLPQPRAILVPVNEGPIGK